MVVIILQQWGPARDLAFIFFPVSSVGFYFDTYFIKGNHVHACLIPGLSVP